MGTNRHADQDLREKFILEGIRNSQPITQFKSSAIKQPKGFTYCQTKRGPSQCRREGRWRHLHSWAELH